MNYFSEHWSMSEWLKGSSRVEVLVAEDSTKRARLALLGDLMDVPSVRSRRFSYQVLLEPSADFLQFAALAGDSAYALRLNPRREGEVRRQRGLTVGALTEWAVALKLDPEAYVCDFEPHVSSVSSTIFVCSQSGVWGEFNNGPLLDLNRGSVDEPAHLFNVPWTRFPEGVPSLPRLAVEKLQMTQLDTRTRVQSSVGVQFAGPHLLGYFEAILDGTGDLWFVDFNRLLVQECPWREMKAHGGGPNVMTGRTGSRGKARGVVHHAALSTDPAELQVPYVLVARFTTPELIPLMARAAGVVTEVGGVLSHAAIACRELGVPCLVGVKDATERLAEGLLVECDADSGLLWLMK